MTTQDGKTLEELDFSNTGIIKGDDFKLFGDDIFFPEYILYMSKIRKLTHICSDASQTFSDKNGDSWDIFWEIEGTDVQLMYVAQESTYFIGDYVDINEKIVLDGWGIETIWHLG